jgi:hypothetical protein
MCRTQAVHPTSNTDHADGTASGAGIGELFRQWGQAYINTYKPCKQHIKLIKSIQVCRTPALGGIVIPVVIVERSIISIRVVDIVIVCCARV